MSQRATYGGVVHLPGGSYADSETPSATGDVLPVARAADATLPRGPAANSQPVKVAASVHRGLLSQARATGRPFNEAPHEGVGFRRRWRAPGPWSPG